MKTLFTIGKYVGVLSLGLLGAFFVLGFSWDTLLLVVAPARIDPTMMSMVQAELFFTLIFFTVYGARLYLRYTRWIWRF